MRIQCKKCETIIDGSTQRYWEMEMCPCGAVGLDETKDYVRVIGDPEDYESWPFDFKRKEKEDD